MRTGLFLTLTLGWVLLGATCLSPYSGVPAAAPHATALGVSILSPSSSTTVPQGTAITVRWMAFNDTGLSNTAALLAESRTGLTQTVIVDGIEVSGTQTITTQWDTTGFQDGAYAIVARISTPYESATASSAALITVDVPPTFEFTQPAEDATFTTGGTLTIGWNGFDPGEAGRVAVGLDPDTDHESGNEVFIHEADLPAEAADDSFDWSGNDLSVAAVELGTYNLFASLNDDVNPEHFVDADVQITVAEPSEGDGDGADDGTDDGDTDEDDEQPDEAALFSITSPAEDTTFLRATAALEVGFSSAASEDVLIDLKIDTDDDHGNGNEQTILSQRLVPADTETDTFSWDGRLAGSGNKSVPDGIYRLFLVVNTGGSTPETADGPGLVFRRTTEDQPLVALLQPGQIQTVGPGQYVTIRWRDDDPAETATIRLALDDDPEPAEGEDGSDESDIAEIDIVRDRAAAADGDLQDGYIWQIPGSLEPGTYYVFAYIVAESDEPGDSQTQEYSSVAPGRLIVRDPASP